LNDRGRAIASVAYAAVKTEAAFNGSCGCKSFVTQLQLLVVDLRQKGHRSAAEQDDNITLTTAKFTRGRSGERASVVSVCWADSGLFHRLPQPDSRGRKQHVQSAFAKAVLALVPKQRSRFDLDSGFGRGNYVGAHSGAWPNNNKRPGLPYGPLVCYAARACIN
jgi:hypothetical protein